MKVESLKFQYTSKKQITNMIVPPVMYYYKPDMNAIKVEQMEDEEPSPGCKDPHVLDRCKGIDKLHKKEHPLPLEDFTSHS